MILGLPVKFATQGDSTYMYTYTTYTCTCTYRAEESPRGRMANYFSLVLIILLYRHYSCDRLVTRCTNRRVPCNAVWATRCILYVQCTDMWPWHDCLCWQILASSSSVFDFSSGCFKHSTSGITAKLFACSTPFGCTTTQMSTNWGMRIYSLILIFVFQVLFRKPVLY